MTKHTMNVVKGVTVGLAAGVAVGMAGHKMIQSNPNLKKKANKAMHTMENVIETAKFMMK